MSDYLIYNKHIISLAVRNTEARKFVDVYSRKNIWVEFKDLKDWFFYFGSTGISSSTEFAVDYYADVGDVEKSLIAFDLASVARLKTPVKTKREFESILIAEKVLEEFLEHHIKELETDLKLIPKGRQYSTIAGPIDLLAKDRNDNYVVIELKRGRAPDKVIGQVTRYIAYVGNNLTTPNKVRAIIVGKEIDRKLVSMREYLRYPCALYEFDFKFSRTLIA